jgi:hypothetical protein
MMSNDRYTFVLLLLGLTLTAFGPNEAQAEGCGKKVGRAQISCLQTNKPMVYATAEAACNGKKGQARWNCRVRAYANLGVTIHPPERDDDESSSSEGGTPSGVKASPVPGTGRESPTGHSPDPSTARGSVARPGSGGSSGSESGLTWIWYNMPPWTTDVPPAVSTGSKVGSEVGNHLERDLDSGNPKDNVSADWFITEATGKIYVETAGTYLFNVQGRHCYMKLELAREMVVLDYSSGRLDEELEIYFDSPGWKNVTLLVAHGDGNAEWAVKWRRPGDASLVSIADSAIKP